MIVRCPECQTGFNLAKEKIPAKGAKLRCSKCDHLFRVRVTDGRAEIFYKTSDKEKNRDYVDPNATQIGGPHRPKIDMVRETHQLDTVERGGETRFGAPARTGTSPRTKGIPKKSLSEIAHQNFSPIKPMVHPLRAPILTPVITPEVTKEIEPDHPILRAATPIISSSRRKLTPLPSDHLDLFGDDSGFNFSNNDPSIEDPFFGAFDEPEEEEDLFQASNESIFSEPGMFSKDSKATLGKNETSAISEISIVESAAPPSLPVKADAPAGFQSNSLSESKIEESEDYFTRGGSARSFESLGPSSEVEEDHSEEKAPEIDLKVQTKKVEKSKKPPREEKLELAIKPKPKTIKRPAREQTSPRTQPSPRVETKARQPMALKPHKIGGNSFRRLFDTLFIALVLLVSFVGIIAYKAGGVFDFNSPLQMLEVAFGEKSHQVAAAAPLYISNLIAIPYDLGKKNHILIVNGSINNPNKNQKSAKPIYVLITTEDGEEKQEVHLGEHLDFSQFKERSKGESLATTEIETIKKGSTPFFVVFRKEGTFQNLSLRTQFEP